MTSATVAAPAAAAPRNNKTLAWFCDDLFDKKNASACTDPTPKEAAAMACAKKVEGGEKKARSRRAGRRTAKKPSTDSSCVSDESAYSEDGHDDRQKIVQDFKDDYWYYDVASDGYYYEQNGAKGWRRRMPNAVAQKLREQELASQQQKPSATAASQQVQQQQQQQAAAAAQAAQAALLQQALFGQPHTKYYDAASDGYFYEMASVDGWKKRQPGAQQQQQQPQQQMKKQLPAPPPQLAHQPSYGAMLARGQMPSNYVISDSSASSSVSDDAPLFPGLEEELSRPSSLCLPKGELSGFNVDKFIAGLSFGTGETPRLLEAGTPRSAAWTPRADWGFGAIGQRQEDREMEGLLKDIEKIWSTPCA